MSNPEESGLRVPRVPAGLGLGWWAFGDMGAGQRDEMYFVRVDSGHPCQVDSGRHGAQTSPA